MSIKISYIKDHSISVDQARCSTSIVDKYIDTTTVKTSTNVYQTTFTPDIIFTKDDVSTSDEQVENLTKEFNIHYRACIGSLIYFLSTIVYLSFEFTKVSNFHKILVN